MKKTKSNSKHLSTLRKAPFKIKEMPKSILIKRTIKSQQIEAPNKPIVDLIVGDIVELNKNGIYFTRKIRLNKEANLQSVFNDLKRNNNIKEVSMS